jgi:TetR/AcrR family transcriptional regulator, transcriptional repressor for nem operon
MAANEESRKTANHRRDHILCEAVELFRTRGYSATSISSLLDRADIHPGSLYHFFPSKHDLLIGALEHQIDRLKSEHFEREVWKDIDDPLQRIFALFECERGKLVEGNCYRCFLMAMAVELRAPDPRVASLLVEAWATWLDRVSDCVRGVPLRPGIDPRAVAEFILIVLQGAMSAVLAAGDLAPFDRAREQMRRYMAIVAAT